MHSRMSTPPTMKKMKAVVLGPVSKASTRMKARAVRIPPRACPLTTAVMNSEGNSPATP